MGAGGLMYKGILAGLVLACTLGLQAENVVLVELFTSEGCSSCPPADALLRQINGTHTKGGDWVVGISEHVTYWNSLGWTDPFSSAIYTDRQNSYGQRFHLDGVYTPQMVVNGAEQIVGSDRGALARAVQAEEQQPPRLALHILSVSQEGSTLTVQLSTDGDLPTQGADLMAVVVDDSDRSSVLRGENSGETLAHVSVARSLARVAKLQATGERTVQVSIPSSVQAAEKHHVILFAQTPGNGRVLGADSKPL